MINKKFYFKGYVHSPSIIFLDGLWGDLSTFFITLKDEGNLVFQI